MPPIYGFYWSPSPTHLDEEWNAFVQSGANSVVIQMHALTDALLKRCQQHSVMVYVDLPLFAGADLRVSFPDSAPVDEHGSAMGIDNWYVPLCPNHARIRAHRLANLRGVLERHGDALHGIWLDFVRYPLRWEVPQPNLMQTCFCDQCLALFFAHPLREYAIDERMAAIHAILHKRLDAWVEWKCQRIAGFVQDIRDFLRTHRPDLRLGLFALPWLLTDYDAAIRTIAGQDVTLLGRRVDAISPMVYHRLCGQSPEWIADVVEEMRMRSCADILPIVQTIDAPGALSAAELGCALEIARTVSDQGVLLFDLSAVARDPGKLAVVREMFER
ncbi:MAG: hypothetical protein NZ699_00415 [Roseiflexus sp.]|nr:hypothetical protein [Roseiflexus sp.]MDW8146941.1 hypothetical protein [Roseiflexaceae bacterium]MDW8232552.1 hypothetical protein [Roseiflexaceae bacterium]